MGFVVESWVIISGVCFKDERIDARQIETLEEIFKRLSFKAIDLEHTTFEDETCTATLFEILGYYDTVEKLIISNSRTTINLMGWQELSKFIRKVRAETSNRLRLQLAIDYVIVIEWNSITHLCSYISFSRVNKTILKTILKMNKLILIIITREEKSKIRSKIRSSKFIYIM